MTKSLFISFAIAFFSTAASAHNKAEPHDDHSHQKMPSCSEEAVTLPMEGLSPPFLNLESKGSNFRFGESSAILCIQDDRVTVIGEEEKTIICTDITKTNGKGIGHRFSDGNQNYDLWFVIDEKQYPLTLQFGLWRADAENKQLFWANTSAEICNI